MIECPNCGGYNVLFLHDEEISYCECWECGEAWCPAEDKPDRAMTEAELKLYFNSLDNQS